jgi:hypothetical protein
MSSYTDRARKLEADESDVATPLATPIQRKRAEGPVWSGAGNAVTRTFAQGADWSGDPHDLRNVEVGGSNPLTSTRRRTSALRVAEGGASTGPC